MYNNDQNITFEFIKKIIDNRIISIYSDSDNVIVITIHRNDLLLVLKSLRDNPSMAFQYFTWMTTVDYPDDDYRFHVIYDLRNNTDFRRLRIKVTISEKDAWIPTVTGIFPTANWHEREMMEMFGITVKDHPDPRKLLLPDWVNDNPLRKDFPHKGEELWAFHQKIISMFNEDNQYQGSLSDPWLERFDE